MFGHAGIKFYNAHDIIIRSCHIYDGTHYDGFGNCLWGGHDRTYPTNEPQYNYFDTLTRLYIEAIGEPSGYPAVFRLDEFEFYQEVHGEAIKGEQVYSIAAAYVPAERRVILTWSRNKSENDVPHEVRYAFESIHLIGWDKATPAPGGTIAPAGFQGYNGMVYTTTDIWRKRYAGDRVEYDIFFVSADLSSCGVFRGR